MTRAGTHLQDTDDRLVRSGGRGGYRVSCLWFHLGVDCHVATCKDGVYTCEWLVEEGSVQRRGRSEEGRSGRRDDKLILRLRIDYRMEHMFTIGFHHWRRACEGVIRPRLSTVVAETQTRRISLPKS